MVASALRAMEWIDKWGDTDGDGFIEYAKQSPTGLSIKDGKIPMIRSCMPMAGLQRRRFDFAKSRDMRFELEWRWLRSRKFWEKEDLRSVLEEKHWS